MDYATHTDSLLHLTSNCYLDLQHTVWLLTLDAKLHLAPIKESPRVLDVGCGTGIWSIEYGNAPLFLPLLVLEDNVNPYHRR